MKLGRVLKREFWRVVVKLLPLKKFRRELRAYEQQPFVEHKVYGRIYLPHYYSGEILLYETLFKGVNLRV